MSPFHKKVLQRELILLMHAFGRMKGEHQNVVIPEMTILISSNLAENDRVVTDQDVFVDYGALRQLEMMMFISLQFSSQG